MMAEGEYVNKNVFFFFLKMGGMEQLYPSVGGGGDGREGETGDERDWEIGGMMYFSEWAWLP